MGDCHGDCLDCEKDRFSAAGRSEPLFDSHRNCPPSRTTCPPAFEAPCVIDTIMRVCKVGYIDAEIGQAPPKAGMIYRRQSDARK